MGGYNSGGNYQGNSNNPYQGQSYSGQRYQSSNGMNQMGSAGNMGGVGGMGGSYNNMGGSYGGMGGNGMGGMPGGIPAGQPIVLQEGYEIVRKKEHSPLCSFVLGLGSIITFARNLFFNLIFLALIAFFLIGFVGLSAFKDSFERFASGNVEQYAQLTPDAQVLCLDLRGTVSEIPFGSTSLDQLQRELEFALYGRHSHELLAIEKALELVHFDPMIKKILIKIDGMGELTLSMAERIGKAMEFAKAKNTSHPHEVIVVGTNFSQTAYALAAHADKVILDPLGEIDFKGLSLSSLFFKDLLDKAEVTPYIFRAGHFKSAVEPFMLNGMSYDVRKEYEAVAYKSWSLYKDIVRKREQIKNQDILPDAQTYISWLERFSGDRAKLQQAEGFVDRVMPLESYYQELAHEVVADGEDPNRPALITYQDYLMRYFVNTQGPVPFGTLSAIPTPQVENNEKPASQNIRLNVQQLAEKLAKADTPEEAARKLEEFYKETASMLPNHSQRIEVIYGIGEIVDFAEQNNDFTPDNIVPLLDRARLDDEVLGVVLYLNSPGGSVNASEKIRRAIEEFRSTGKPLYVSMNGTAASGAYWIACQAEKIYATPTTITGSIGVFGLSFGAHKLLNRFGAYQDGVSTNELAQPAIGKEMPASQQKMLSLNVEKTYKNFLALVSTNRKLDILAYPRYAEGQIFLADDAQNLGLVDQVGTLNDAIQDMQRALRNNKNLKLTGKVNIQHISPSSLYELTGIESLFFGLSAKYLPDQVTEALIELKQQSRLMKGVKDNQAVLAISPLGEPKL